MISRQCGQCGFGPVDHRGCSNLATHHGEVCVSGDPGVGTALFSCEREGLVERVDDVVQLPPPVSE